MLLKKTLAVICLAVSPALALAATGPEAGERFFTLSGSGASDKDFDSNTVSVSFDVGRFHSDSGAYGVRQSLGFADINDDSNWTGATRAFYDYHFDTGERWRPFIGGNLGGIYGEGIDETFFAGPELGVKYYVRRKTYITVQAEYQVFFDNAGDAEDNFDDGAFAYSAGIGYHF
ncbi:hypothetical protein [Marinobacter sp. X15-166B]|uniref:hypothetical protein n=1 Tax=Marinobacter sp. X15-166B TaxID=1897620 RepID=UPI00085BCDFF|nr:hypothetical protein [Marinobacter sp. X15-166B]OEY65364.1 hypothetical protein BG841_02090 [Marinobacter sp. X15-166B]